jgi:flagellar biogenesis protein FliO
MTGPRDESGHTPATGSDDQRDTELRPDEEPTTTGTLFLVMIILMIIAAIWVIMYLRLLDR